MLRLHIFLISCLLPLWMMAQVVVTNTNDSGPGSLRDAIMVANTNSATDNITFNIGGGGAHTITPLTDLPTINDANIVLDGTSQPGYTGAPLITIDGTNVTNGIIITGDSGIIQGLKVINCGRVGISFFNCTSMTIQNNVLFDSEFQILATGLNTNNRIENNLINIDENGVVGNFSNYGIWLQSTSTGCIISGNTIAATNNFIYPAAAIMLIAEVSGTLISDNYIGTNASGANIGNLDVFGILQLQGASNNRVEFNTIAFCNYGIFSDEVAVNNLFSSNNYSCNKIAAIENSGGANLGIPPPTITSALTNVIRGTAPGGSGVIELYVQDNSACPTNSVCQGAYLKTVNLTSSNWSTTVNLPEGAIVSANYTDSNNNSSEFSTCTTVVPPITCPADATVECGMSTDPAATGTATGSDGCGGVSFTFTDFFIPGCGSGTGTIARTWTATDDCGLMSTCTQDITIVDTTPPSITCPPDVTLECGDSTAPADTGEATATDACESATVNFDDSFVAACGSGTGLISRKWTATDGCGNMSNCTQLITIVDTTPPVVSCTEFTATFEGCPTSVGANTPNGDYFAIGPDGGFTAASGGIFTQFLDLSNCISDACSPLENLEVTLAESYEENRTDCSVTLVNEFFVRDECGNVADDRIITRFTIENTSDVAIVCPADQDIACGSPTTPADTGMATATDACGDVDVSFTDEITMRCSAGSYVIIRTWTAEGCGVPTSCEQTIILRDEVAPVFDIACQVDETFFTEDGELCPVDATISLEEGDELSTTDTWTVGGNTMPSLAGCLSDNCALEEEIVITVDDITITHLSTCSRTIAVTFIADDGCGNFSDPFVCNYTFIDDTAPVFDLSCQIDVTFFTEDGDVCPADAMISLSEGDELSIFDGWTVGGNAILPLESCVDDNCTDASDLTITVDDITVVDEGTCSRTITVTFIADDGCGNFSDPFVCNYTFIDDTAPVFDLSCQIDVTFFTEDGDVCPADAMISLSEGDELSIFDGWTVGGNAILPLESCVDDNCTDASDLTITVDDITVVDEGTCSRTITVTFIADDGCGNFSDPFVCNYTFIDDTAPVFDLSCQIDVTFFTEDGDVCPADAMISLSEGDELSIFDGWTVGGNAILPLESCVDDNCTDASDLTITVDDITVVDDGTCSRTITVTFIADDGCGNFSEPFVCNYTFVDNTGPEVSFNGIPDGGTYVVECDLPSTDWDPLTDIGELTITDNCSDVDIAGITEVLTQLYDGPCAGNILTRWQQVFTVMDVCGNTTVYTLFTEIIDTTPPVFDISPEDVTIECDEEADTPEMVAFDSCSEVDYGFTEVRTDGDCPNNYTLTRTWTATDGCGNASSEVQIITVEDTTPPVIEFIDGYINQYEPGQDVFVSCEEYGNIFALIANNAVATDNCSGNTPVEYSFEDLGRFDCAEFGYIGRLISTWESKDECGNSSTATINWYLVDETAPVFQNVPEDACAGNTLPPVANVQATDECDFATVTFSESEPLDCGDGGQYIERTWTAVDDCGNTATATQRITLGGGTDGPSISINYPEIGDVNDGDLIQLPIDCDQDIAFSVEELEAAIIVGEGCGVGEANIELTLMDEGDCSENGYFARYRVNITASDPCGNTSNFGIIVDFVDATGPVVSSPESITLNCGDDIPMLEASDACGEIASMTFVDSTPIETSCAANPVAYTRVWTVRDACGNSTSFTQSITIIDNAGPVFSGVPADACNNLATDVIVRATDGCTGQETDVQFSETTTNESGCGQVLTRTWTATDACGNTSTATQQVFFTDDVAPAISFSNDLLFGLESGDELFLNVGDGFGDPNNPLLFTADDVTVTDNCATLTAAVSIETTLSEDCAADGYLARYEYKFTATDPCGNSNSIGLIVFYQDGNAPDFFNTPADVDVFCSAVPEVAELVINDDYDQDVEVVFSETQMPTDGGVLITRTWTATDDCGNTSSFSQEILVVDNDLAASFSLGGTIECNTDNNRLGVTASGGTAPYTYEWQLTVPLEDGYITTDPTRPAILFTMGYISQTFSVLITDANGCELLASVTVECDFSDDEGDFLIGQDNNSVGINAYPNPTDQFLNITIADAIEQPATVSLYNLFGQELFRKEFREWPAEGLEVDTQQLPNGTYLLRIEREGEAPVSREIIVLH